MPHLIRSKPSSPRTNFSHPFRFQQIAIQSIDTRVPQTNKGPRPTMRSWSQVVRFLIEWHGLRRLAVRSGAGLQLGTAGQSRLG